GTTNLANSIPWTAFSLALAIDRDPVVGIVADPWRGDLFEAVSGHGARLNGTDLTISDTPASDTPASDTIAWDTIVTDTIGSHTTEASAGPLSGKVIGTELAAHLPWPGMLSLLAALGERHATLRVMGSGTLTLVGVAAGRGAGAVIGTFGPVDHLAAALIVQESGGVVLNADGVPDLFPHSGGIMAASAAAASELYELWREARRGEEVTA
ncbi:MAG TPA: inositol monophosphatase family protein, partial [Micrococcaceae bacterium]|nr:inositol monophosphatase family protein [Micrococcaceae bacterium]